MHNSTLKLSRGVTHRMRTRKIFVGRWLEVILAVAVGGGNFADPIYFLLRNCLKFFQKFFEIPFRHVSAIFIVK